jgi:Bacterial lectin
MRLGLFAVAAAFFGSLAATQAGSFVSDFNSGLPAGSAVYGDAAVLDSGGFNNSGFLQLNPDAGSKNGAFVISPDLDAGTPVVSFTASFKVLIGGGGRWDYADGISFNFAPGVPLGTDGLPENGVGGGLSVTFRTYPNGNAGNPNPEPTIRVLGAGTPVMGSPAYVDTLRANTFVDMVVQLNPDNTLDVIYDGAYVYSKVPLGYTPGAGSLFWIGARTGGSYEKHFIDNLNIATRTAAAPYISTFAPRGRQVPSNGALDIVLTDNNTQVDTGSVVLLLDGVSKTPTITPDGSGHTTIHFAPSSAFAASSQHTVSLTFADNASPTPQSQTFSWNFTVAEALPTDFVTVFSEGFESQVLGKIDKEFLYWWGVDGPNAAPNGTGNPWFGPTGPNGDVVDSSDSEVVPHSGNQMFRGNSAGDQDILWCDLAYRVHDGQPIKGNCRLDWWIYDPATSTTTTAFKDYVSLYYYNDEGFPVTADWPAALWDDAWPNIYWGSADWTLEQGISLGGSGYNEIGGNYDPTKYQIRLEENRGATYGNDGWCNTAVARSAGWHHNRILLGPPHADGTVMVYFYIDDMATPVYSNISTLATTGFGLLEIATAWGDTDIAYYDDLSFALVRPPNLVMTCSGSNMILTWPGEGFTLQKADSVAGGTWSDVTTTSGYSYDPTTSPQQYFRLRN